MMEKVPIHELKRRLSKFLAAVEGGVSFLVTRHKRVVAQLSPPSERVHVGARFGAGRLVPLLNGRTRGRYLDVIADDRRGGADA